MTTFIERLDAAGVSWEREFCEFGGGTAYISFRRDHPHAMGYKQYEAIIYVKVDGEWKHKVFKAFEGGSVPERRRLAVEKAQEWAGERLGGPEWVAGPFPDSWQTKDTRERVTALLDEMRAS
jgi:hypothetical protein